MLTTNQKGLIAETAIIHVDLRPRLLRVQCKWASLVGHVVARLYWNRRGPGGMITRRYTPEEIDCFAVHCAELGSSYLLPADVCAVREIRLRLQRARNNQLRGVRWARDYEFGARLVALQGP